VLALCSQKTDTFVIKTDGSGRRQLTEPSSFDKHLVWSRDGLGIAFQTDRDGTFEVHIMHADVRNPRPLGCHNFLGAGIRALIGLEKALPFSEVILGTKRTGKLPSRSDICPGLQEVPGGNSSRQFCPRA